LKSKSKRCHKTMSAIVNSGTLVRLLIVSAGMLSLGSTSLTAQVPAAATAVEAQPLGARKMLITWTDNALDETSYIVERATSSGATSWIASAALPADTTSYEDIQGLQGGTLYYYRVKTINANGESVSTEGSATTLDYPTPNEAPDGIGLFTFNLGLNFSSAKTDAITMIDGLSVDAAKDGDIAFSTAGEYWFKRQVPTSPPNAQPLDEVDVYAKDTNGDWVYQTTLQPPLSAGSSSGFGTCVVAQDGLVFIGAPGAVNGASESCGMVYVYELEGTTLTHVQTLEPTVGVSGDEFGFALAVDENKLIVGAPGTEKVDTTTITDAGAAYFYEKGTSWTLLRTEWGQTSEAGCKFGFSVSIRGRVLAIGAPYEDVTFSVPRGVFNLADSGTAYLGLWNRPNEFARYTNLYWFFGPVQEKIEGMEGAHFGWSVSVGDMMRVAVGMPDNSWTALDGMTGWDSGLVMIFHWHGIIDTGKQFVVDVFSHDDLAAGDRFGEYIEKAEGGMDFGTQTALRVANSPVHYYSMEALLVQPGSAVGGVEQLWNVGDLFGVDPNDDPVTFLPPVIADVPGSHFEIVNEMSFATKSSLSLVINGLHPVWFRAIDDRGGSLMMVTNLELSGGAADLDGDRIPDWWETGNGLNPSDPGDGDLDSDADGLSNQLEYQRGTSPTLADTDGDNIPDGQELAEGSDPLDPGNSSKLAELYVYTRLE
jgi:hypothetical protein